MAFDSREEGADVQLVVRAQAGDIHAFDALVRRYRRGLTSLVRMQFPDVTADDVVQDALLTAFKCLPRLQDPTRFAGWLITILRRRAVRSATERAPATGLDQILLGYLPAMTERLIAQEQHASLHRAVARLPNDLAAVVTLYYLDELQIESIARLLQVPATTVNWRLRQARVRLQRLAASCQD